MTLKTRGAALAQEAAEGGAAQTPLQGYTGGQQGFLLDRARFIPVNVQDALGTVPLGIKTIVGIYDDKDLVSHGFVFDGRGDGTIDHPEADGSASTSLAGSGLTSVNNRGQSVGAYIAGGRAHGFVLDHGHFTPIDAPGAQDTTPFGINDVGQITIQATTPDGTHAMYLLDHGRFTPISFPGATETVVHKINDLGQAVGVHFDDNPGQHGFVFEHDRYVRHDLPGVPYTGVNSSNSRGEFVGYYADDPAGPVHAYVMDHGKVTRVDAPGATHARRCTTSTGSVSSSGPKHGRR